MINKDNTNKDNSDVKTDELETKRITDLIKRKLIFEKKKIPRLTINTNKPDFR